MRRVVIVLWDISLTQAARRLRHRWRVDEMSTYLHRDGTVRARCVASAPGHHGVTIEREAMHGGARGMGHSFYIRDPFGNLLEVKGRQNIRMGAL